MNNLVVPYLARLCCVLLPTLISSPLALGREQHLENGDESVRMAHDTLKVQHTLKSAPVQPEEGRPNALDMFTNVPGDWGSCVSIAVRPSSLPYVAGIAGLTGVLVAADNRTDGLSKRAVASSAAVRSTSSVIVRLGDGRTHLAIAAGFALYGLALDDSRSIRTGSETVEALLSCGIAVQVLKRIAGRESPQAATTSRGVWRLFPNLRTYQRHQSKYYAFPSGHIATTMATLTVIAENFPEDTWIRPVGYSMMACLGMSLVNVGYHWYSDFPLGLAMGYMFGMIAAHHQDNLFASLANDSYSGLRVMPSVTRNGTGVALALQF